MTRPQLRLALTALVVIPLTLWGLYACATPVESAQVAVPQRFERISRDNLDNGITIGVRVDVVRDTFSDVCYAVYSIHNQAATTLGPVPCEAPPASGVR